MKYLFLFVSLAGLISCSTSNEKKPSTLKVSYEDFQKILQPRDTLFMEGQNALLTVIAFPGDTHPSLYRYDLATKKWTKDYDHGQSISGLSQDRQGRQIYVSIDNKGDENFGIYKYDPLKKSVTPFFVKPGFKSFIVNSDKDVKNLFIGSNFENKSVYSVYKFDLKTEKLERLTDGKTNYFGTLVSPSGNTVIVSRALSNNENQLFAVDVKTKKISTLFKHKNTVFNPTYFSPNEESLFGDTDYQNDRTGCAEISLKKPKVKYILQDAQKDISCDYGEWSQLYFVTEKFKGRSSLRAFQRPFQDEIQFPNLFNNQSISAIDFDRKNHTLLLQYSAANNPGSLYLFSLKTKTPELALNYNLSPLAEKDLATTYDFDYKSFDGLPVHGILHAKPEWLTSGKKYPLIVWPHGGPDHAESHNYRGIFQFLSLNGYVVFAPNYRGSTGYGKKFETLNDKDWGGAHIKDLIAGKNEVAKLPYIDANNIFILGGSFGGYSTLATITFQPQEFKAAVGVVAIGNLFTFMKSIPPDEAWQTEFKKEIGDPEKDKALYMDRSPFFHVKNIQIPLQIYQAENDVRTVKAEMDQFVEEMKKNNKPVQYTVLKDVGHGLETPRSRQQVYEGAVEFFNSFL